MRKDRYDWLLEVIKAQGDKMGIDLHSGELTFRKAFTTKDGYKRIGLCYRNVKKMFYIHEIIAVAGGLNPTDLTINHIDGNKTNNSIYNLECISSKDNSAHAGINNLLAVGERNTNAKLTEEKVRYIRETNPKGKQVSEVAATVGVSESTVYRVLKRRLWKHI